MSLRKSKEAKVSGSQSDSITSVAEFKTAYEQNPNLNQDYVLKTYYQERDKDRKPTGQLLSYYHDMKDNPNAFLGKTINALSKNEGSKYDQKIELIKRENVPSDANFSKEDAGKELSANYNQAKFDQFNYFVIKYDNKFSNQMSSDTFIVASPKNLTFDDKTFKNVLAGDVKDSKAKALDKTKFEIFKVETQWDFYVARNGAYKSATEIPPVIVADAKYDSVNKTKTNLVDNDKLATQARHYLGGYSKPAIQISHQVFNENTNKMDMKYPMVITINPNITTGFEKFYNENKELKYVPETKSKFSNDAYILLKEIQKRTKDNPDFKNISIRVVDKVPNQIILSHQAYKTDIKCDYNKALNKVNSYADAVKSNHVQEFIKSETGRDKETTNVKTNSFTR